MTYGEANTRRDGYYHIRADDFRFFYPTQRRVGHGHSSRTYAPSSIAIGYLTEMGCSASRVEPRPALAKAPAGLATGPAQFAEPPATGESQAGQGAAGGAGDAAASLARLRLHRGARRVEGQVLHRLKP